jgi:hypothetical protein
MPGPEATIERKCETLAQYHGCELFKVKFSGRVGFPDRMLVIPSDASWDGFTRIVLVEFKRPSAKPSPVQTLVHGTFDNLGVPVRVISSVPQFRRLLKAWMNQ